jgi:hypothetical protein
MWHLSWLRKRQNRPARRLARYRPGVEVLEGRCLPSTVTNLNDAGSGSLRDAIASTPSGGTVDFQAGLTGTILLSGDRLWITKDLTIAGPGADLITVSANSAGFASQVLEIGAFTVNISGMTIANGSHVDLAGGILNRGTLTVTNCTLSGNSATYGGGILNYGTLTVTNSTLSGNSAGALGGGIWNQGTVTVTNCTLSGNSGGEFGGGITNAVGGTLTVISSTLTGNSASVPSPYYGGGGGICTFGSLTVTNSTFSGNSASGSHSDGGGIFSAVDSSMVTVTSCTLSGNSTSGGDASGGGFRGSGLFRNTIIAGNTAPNAPDLFGDLGSQGYNLIGNIQGASGFVATDLLEVDPLLGPLQNNGGPTQTMALLAGSPALNAGDPAQMGVADQRGVVRSGGVNIGAYQASASTFVLTAPATRTAGTAFDLTVKAVDPFGQTALGYRGTAQFTSSDPLTVPQDLPGNYTFTSSDAGQHIFTNGVTLKTAGNQTVTATDTGAGSISGSATVAVNPAAADHLLFQQQPTGTAAGQTIAPAVTVAVVDQFGNVLTDDNTDMVTISIGADPSSGTAMLGGTLTVTVSGGIATFTDLSIDLAGDGYTLHATIGGSLPDIDSSAFSIT